MENDGNHTRIDIPKALMLYTVTLAAYAAAQDIYDAYAAFSSFIVAANLLNDLNARVSGAGETTVYQEAIPRARIAARTLRITADLLAKSLAPRGPEEPDVPASAKFTDED